MVMRNWLAGRVVEMLVNAKIIVRTSVYSSQVACKYWLGLEERRRCQELEKYKHYILILYCYIIETIIK